MSEAEYGIVKFYNGNKDKMFGFVTVLDANGAPTTTELFFHYNNGYFLREGVGVPEFRFETGTMTETKVKHIKPPEKGTKLVFIRGINTRGEKVAKWGYAERWNELVEHIANRPVYRVVRKTTNLFYKDPAEQLTEHVAWQGQNTLELSARFPKRVRFGRISDDLGFGSAEDGYMSWSILLEQQMPDGTWKTCEGRSDPRVFLCCVPRDTFIEHGSRTMDQGRCFHGNR